MAADHRHIAIYVRISKDRTGNVEGVDRQTKRGRAYAGRMVADGRWPDLPVRVYPDNDLSAFDDDTVRPEYDRLRQAIRDGEVAGLWCVEQTRLEANRRRWVDLAYELDEAGIDEIHTDRDGIVRLDEVADIKATLSWHERKRLRERTNDTLGDLAAEGRAPGGSVFGYRHTVDDGRKKLEPDPVQGPAVKQAAERLLAGWSLSAIARDLDARGIPTARGGKWGPHTVRTFLRSPTIAARRVYRGRVVGKGEWPALVDAVTFDDVQALLDGRPRQVRPGRRYLLSSFAVCAKCDHPVTGQHKDSGGMHGAYYLCRHPGCYGVAAPVDAVDEVVETTLLGWLSDPRFAAAVAAEDPYAGERDRIGAELRRLKAREDELADRWASDDDMPMADWDRARSIHAARRAQLTAELARLPAPLPRLDPAAVVSAWPDMVVDERRQVIGTYIARIVIAPRLPGVRGFDDRRVTIESRFRF